MSFYIQSVENFTFNKSDESANYLTMRRQKIFLRIQSLRLMLKEIELQRKKSPQLREKFFIFYVLASLELIAEEIEDPFGQDANDLPTKKIAENIKKHIEEIL